MYQARHATRREPGAILTDAEIVLRGALFIFCARLFGLRNRAWGLIMMRRGWGWVFRVAAPDFLAPPERTRETLSILCA